MINRVFFILDNELASHGNLPLSEGGIFYSIAADPSGQSSLQQAYTLMNNTSVPGLALTLNIQTPLTENGIRSLASFLFLPAYLRIAGRPVINLTGRDMALLAEAATCLSAYLSSQGIDALLLYPVLSDKRDTALGGDQLFDSAEALGQYYKRLLESERPHNNTVFFQASFDDALESAFSLLRQAESDFKQNSPGLYSAIETNRVLQDELASLCRRLRSTETELQHQQQYLGILRSGHAAKEIQDYYTREYEMLPLWYKRFGHVLKVLTGKRTFKSLFRDDVKKYKD